MEFLNRIRPRNGRWTTFAIALLFSSWGWAAVWDGTFAATSVQYQESGETHSGLSMRWRYRGFGAGANTSGMFFVADWPGISPVVGQHSLGYGISTQGSMTWDAGIGLSYSPIWSTGLVVLAGTSFEMSEGWTLSLPVIFQSSMGLQFTPYLGWKF